MRGVDPIGSAVPLHSHTPGERWTAASVAWALVPAVTLGLGAAPCFLVAAIRLRQWRLGIAAFAYGCGYLLSLVLAGGDYPDASWQVNLGLFLVFAVVIGSTGHAFAIGRNVFPHRTQPQTPQTALAVARSRVRQRDDARQIALTDPILARDLAIGRPDLVRSFDDGGLVDINHVPADVLGQLEGVDHELALLIVDVRAAVRGFESRDDFEVTLGLDPHRLDRVADLLVFCR